jgi:hypothetical protein
VKIILPCCPCFPANVNNYEGMGRNYVPDHVKSTPAGNPYHTGVLFIRSPKSVRRFSYCHTLVGLQGANA